MRTLLSAASALALLRTSATAHQAPALPAAQQPQKLLVEIYRIAPG